MRVLPVSPLSRWLFLVTIVAIVLAGLFWLIASWRGDGVEVALVRRGPLSQSVVATGRINAAARIELAAQTTATVDAVRVREGDRVRSGQLLVELRDNEATAALAQAQSALAEAKGLRLEIEMLAYPLAEQQLQQAKANLELARAERERARDLLAKGFFSQSRLDDTERNFVNATSAVATAKTQLQANTEGGIQRQLAESRVQQANAALKVAMARQKNLAIAAPMDGMVLTRSVEPGDVAQPGRTLLQLAADGETRIIAQVDEKNLRYLKPGLAASAVADAFPAQPFEATLFYIAPSIDAQRGTVEVRLRVTNPPAFLKPDMTVSVEMNVGKRESALLAPVAAIRGVESSMPYAMAIREGRATRLPLRLGLSGIGEVEVLEGAQEGDALILPNTVQEGRKVRPIAPDAPKPTINVPAGLTR